MSSTKSTFRASNTMLKLKIGKDATALCTCSQKRLRGKKEKRLIGKDDAESNRSYRKEVTDVQALMEFLSSGKELN